MKWFKLERNTRLKSLVRLNPHEVFEAKENAQLMNARKPSRGNFSKLVINLSTNESLRFMGLLQNQPLSLSLGMFLLRLKCFFTGGDGAGECKS